MGKAGDTLPPTPEMLILYPILVDLIKPVNAELQAAGISELRSCFMAAEIVLGVMKDIVAKDIDVGFILKHVTHPV